MTDDSGATWNSPPPGGSPPLDLADWRTVAEAAAAIGCSKRTIERLAAARKLESRLRPVAGSPAIAVYNPDPMTSINQKLGIKPAGRRAMMKLPTDRALRNRVTAAQCPNPKCGQRRAHLSRSKPGWVFCEWCGETWELPAVGS